MAYSNNTIKVAQVAIYPFMHFFFKMFFKANLDIKINLKKKNTYIFTPNHPWRMDPFLIFYLMQFKTLIKILPLRFMTAKKYMKNPINNLILSLLGCYPVDENVLSQSILLLKDNNLCIFIQGRINHENKETPRVGAIYINKEFKRSKIVPVKIKINKRVTFSNILLRRIKINVSFKPQFIAEKFTKNLQPIANELLKTINN